MENRLTNLEIKLAYAEETVRDLNGVVSGQAQEIALLLGRIETLERRLKALMEGSDDGLKMNERPPHY